MAAVALALTLALEVARTVIAKQGGLIVDDTERFPGAALVVQIVNVSTLVTMALMLIALMLGLIAAAQQRQWLWLAAFLALVPIGLLGWLALVFEGGLGLGALAALPPLAALAYALMTRPRPRPADGT